MVAFDGEREVVVEKGESFKVSLEGNGPRVLEVYEIMRIAAEIGDFELD